MPLEVRELVISIQVEAGMRAMVSTSNPGSGSAPADGVTNPDFANRRAALTSSVSWR